MPLWKNSLYLLIHLRIYKLLILTVLLDPLSCIITQHIFCPEDTYLLFEMCLRDVYVLLFNRCMY